ncbi:MAG: RIP metalloprotease RseP [Bacteroidales bacterium]|nr:RIP metalloprotease RseP [Bacteroidales bacterium]
MEIAVQIAQLLVSLSLLIICHEFGHFITAKMFKCEVDKFYLFFNPWFELFKVKRGETEYGIGWIPLGGYVHIVGMIDETTNAEDLEQIKHIPEHKWFCNKPAWQRLIVMLAGVIVNAILAMFIYAMVAFCWGSSYLPVANLKYGISVDSLGYSFGLRDGDMIKSVNGKPADDFAKVFTDLLLDDPKTLTVSRSGNDTTITFTNEMVSKLLDPNLGGLPFDARYPFVVDGFPEGVESVAKKAGFMEGDSVLTFNGLSCAFYSDVRKQLVASKGKEVTIGFVRQGQPNSITLTIPEDGMLGVYVKSRENFVEYKTIEYGFFESFPVGISRGVNKISEYLKQFKLIFNPETKAYKSVGSFITMTKIFPERWNWYAFWNLTAFFSIILAVMNVLPIPALDGGHAMFAFFEMVTGKQLSVKFLERAQIVGMIILLALMVFAIGNDLIRHVFN